MKIQHNEISEIEKELLDILAEIIALEILKDIEKKLEYENERR